MNRYNESPIFPAAAAIKPAQVLPSRVSLSAALWWNISLKEDGGHSRTAANYLSSLGAVRAYLGGEFDRFPLSGVTPAWVEGYASWLRSRHASSAATAEFYFRNFRVMCRRYWRLACASLPGGRDPFAGIAFHVRPASKRALPRESLARLLDPGLRARLTEREGESLDVLHFILFTRGMAFHDVWNLRHDMVGDDGHIRYRRSKTGAPIDVLVTTEAAALMERHRRCGSPWVFPFLHDFRRVERAAPGDRNREPSEESSLKRVNRHALSIGRLVGLPIPLTTYVMRHTWATLMQEAGYSVELIGQCLGHTSEETTRIYLSGISRGSVDRAVDDMLDRLVRPYAQGGPKGKRASDSQVKRRHRKKDTPAGGTERPARKGRVLPEEGATEPRNAQCAVNKDSGGGKEGCAREKKCLFLAKKGTLLPHRFPHKLFGDKSNNYQPNMQIIHKICFIYNCIISRLSRSVDT